MVTAATQSAFEKMAETGRGDAGALALGLRHGVTRVGLRAVAAKAVHVGAAAPDRLADIYDNTAGGWLGRPVFPPRVRTPDPLPISRAWWQAFWNVVGLSRDGRRKVFAREVMRLAGELDPAISLRMASAALEFPGVAEAAAGGIPEPFDMDGLAGCRPASLGYALREQTVRDGGLAAPFESMVPLLRHMPPPLNFINIRVIQCLNLWALVAGYSHRALDQVGMGGFLMGQVGHHYSALSSAVTLTIISMERPESVEAVLDSLLKGWVHGRETRPLVCVDWDELWGLRVDEAREALQITAFDSPYAAAARAKSGAASVSNKDKSD